MASTQIYILYIWLHLDYAASMQYMIRSVRTLFWGVQIPCFSWQLVWVCRCEGFSLAAFSSSSSLFLASYIWSSHSCRSINLLLIFFFLLEGWSFVIFSQLCLFWSVLRSFFPKLCYSHLLLNANNFSVRVTKKMDVESDRNTARTALTTSLL